MLLKSDAENAGIEVDGMANSVSELRSELKSLTGVDIMLDSKNFKSTYQIMKELQTCSEDDRQIALRTLRELLSALKEKEHSD